MKKALIFILLLALTVSLFAGCGKDFLEAEDAQKIALKDLGIKEKDADGIHVHVGEMAQGPAYSVHVEYQGETHEYVILAATGEILSADIVDGH